jgi:type IV secretion system protein VirD4
MWPKSLQPKKDGFIAKTTKHYLNRGVQHLVFGRSLVREEGAEFAKAGDKKKFIAASNTGIPLDGRDARLSERLSFSNVAVYGIVGKGKSTVYARPLILDQAKKKSVLIVNDMSGDLHRDTSGYMKAQGYRIIVLNPNDLRHSNRYNPFLNFRKTTDLMRFAELFSKVQGDTDSKFWSSGGERYIRFILKCIRRFGSEVFNNPPNLYHVLQNFGDTGEDLEEFISYCVEGDQFLKNEWKALTTGAEETITSFVTNALVALKLFGEPHVCALTARSDIDLSDLRKRKTIIYVQTPPEDQDIYRPLVSMYFLSFIHICMGQLPGRTDLPVYFVYDEFGNSFLPGFDTIITNTRKYKISFLLLMQGQQQLVNKYGKDQMSVIMSGIATHVCFGAAEESTAQFFSRKAGKVRKYYRNEERETHIEHQSEHDLISTSEIRELPDDTVLVICDNHKTTLLEVYPSYVNPKYKRMMRFPPHMIRAQGTDTISFIPL